MLEPRLDRAVELADRVELLELRDDLVGTVVPQGGGPLHCREPLGILDIHALRALEEREVAERFLAEW